MSEYTSGARAAKDRLAEVTSVEVPEVAEQLLATRDFDETDAFARGYRDQLAYVLNRWCKHCRQVFDIPNGWRTCPSCLAIENSAGEGFTIHDAARTSPASSRWEIHTLVGSDGGEFLWLFDTTHADEKCPAHTVPAHEELGPLPNETRYRVLTARCGRPTRSGKPCRNGPQCRFHR
ncbi:hypothetical protein [uncultured Gordonia sp.]|uniref:hypothetical protein n=1 Tax=uncultured Gordonia sp. TaxID=198437 RepID=UPI002585D52E|nr:hypothetical protein [uncultured Gordonia sp.]